MDKSIKMMVVVSIAAICFLCFCTGVILTTEINIEQAKVHLKDEYRSK